jgi:hypothetical protein
MIRKTNPISRLLGYGLIVAWLAAAPVAAAGRLSATAANQTTTTDRASGYPNAMVVIGDSGATGLGSDPGHGLRDQPQNSWATGTNPAVDSVYARILALNPAVRDHNANLATDDPSAAQFSAQVRRAAALTPRPDLVILEYGDRGLATCDGNDAANYATVRADWSSALARVTNELPDARILLVSAWGGSYATPWGSIDSYVKYLDGQDKNSRLKHAGRGICQLVDSPSGSVVPSRVAYVKKTWAGYEAQKAASCAQVPQCRYDHGAAMRIAVTAADLTSGGDGMTVAGNAQLAAAEWSVIAAAVRDVPGSLSS